MRIRHTVDAEVIEWRGDFGFVMPTAEVTGGQPVFIHVRNVRNGCPVVGDRLRLEGAQQTPRGWRSTGWIELLED